MWVDPRTLVRNPKNPRRNDAAVPAVARSIQENGFGAPIVARLANRMIIAGDTRWRASVEVLELPVVPVRFLDVTQRQADVLTIADNRLGEFAEWDRPMLVEHLLGMDPTEQLLAGYDADDVGEMARALNPASDDEWGKALGDVPSGDGSGFQQMTFTVTHEQAAVIKQALADVPTPTEPTGNENRNGNALAALAAAFLAAHG